VFDEADLEKLKPGKAAAGCAQGIDVLVYREEGRLYAISDRCSHRGCALHQSRVRDLNITCPCHGSMFSLRNGSVVRGPATAPPTDLRRPDPRWEGGGRGPGELKVVVRGIPTAFGSPSPHSVL